MTEHFTSLPQQPDFKDSGTNFPKFSGKVTSEQLSLNGSVKSNGIASPLVENLSMTVPKQLDFDASAAIEETVDDEEPAEPLLKINGSIRSLHKRQSTNDSIKKEAALTDDPVKLVSNCSTLDGPINNGALPLVESFTEDLATDETSSLLQKSQEYTDLTTFEEQELLESLTHPKPRRRSLDASLPLPKLRFSVSAAIVLAVAVLCFCVSCDGEFVYDDKRAILKNKDLLPETPLSELFQNDFWGKKLTNET
ncbi:MAG: hypothetical protein AB2693_34425, partial [Candidatus Thiodiazotropha sp.]